MLALTWSDQINIYLYWVNYQKGTGNQGETQDEADMSRAMIGNKTPGWA